MDVTSYHFLNRDQNIVFTCHAKDVDHAVRQWTSWSLMRPQYQGMITTLLRIDSKGQWEHIPWD